MKLTRNRHHSLKYVVVFAATVLLVSIQTTEEVQAQDTDATEHGSSDFIGTSEMGLNSEARVTAFERSVALYTILDKTGEEDLRELLKDSRDIDQASDRRNAQVAIASRFASLNPEKALQAALEFPAHYRLPLLEGVFAEWSESDLISATKAAANLDHDSRLTALKSITAMRDDLDVDELRSIARELGHAGHINDIDSDLMMVDLVDDPKEAWYRLIHDGLEDASQIDTLVQLAEAAVELEGLDVLFHLQAPFSRTFFEEELFVLDAAVQVLVKNDPQAAWEYIQNGSLIELGHTKLPIESSGIRARSPQERSYMTDVVQEMLLKSWATWDPAFVLERLEEIPRQLQATACERALEALVTTESKRAIDLIQTLRHLGAGSDRAIRRVVRAWSTVDPAAAHAWFQSTPDHAHLAEREYPMMYVLSALALVDPEKALQAAAQSSNPSRLEGLVIYEFARNNLEAAIELLPSVSPSSQSRANAWVTIRLIENGEVDRAYALRSQYLEDSGESDDWYWFFTTWARENPVQLFERLDDLAPKWRYDAARALDYYDSRELTRRQMATVQAIHEAGQN